MLLGWNDFQKWLAQSAASLPQETSTGQGRRATVLHHDSEELKVPESSKKKKKIVFLYVHRRWESAFTKQLYTGWILVPKDGWSFGWSAQLPTWMWASIRHPSPNTVMVWLWHALWPTQCSHQWLAAWPISLFQELGLSQLSLTPHDWTVTHKLWNCW